MGEPIRSFNQSKPTLEWKPSTPSAALSDRGALQYSSGVYTVASVANAFAWRALRQGRRNICLFALLASSLLLTVFLGLHFAELSRVPFTPQINAYASIFYVLNWGLDLVVIIGWGLTVAALVRSWFEEQHWQLYLGQHMQMAAHFGYFTAMAALIVYATVYLSPYVI